MKFYRRLTQIKAISFDLDDTLYHNKPVMQAIEKKMIAYFAGLLPLQSKLHAHKDGLNHHFWSVFRRQAVLQQPDLAHDVVQVRLVTYRLGFLSLGLSLEAAQQHAQAALDYFIEVRSDFTVPELSKKTLANLSQKFPLVAISNGNVDTSVLSIDHYFDHIYHAGWQTNGNLLKQKPSGDMFALVCKQLAIQPSQLLHVGDCGYADIQGALRAGCQTAWFPRYGVGKPIHLLPHLEFNQINQLEQLL